MIQYMNLSFAQEQKKIRRSLFPSTVKVPKGTSSSRNPSLLRYRTLTGNVVDNSAAITFTPAPSKILVSTFIFKMPSSSSWSADDVSIINVEANIKTPDPGTNVYRIQIRNNKTKKWELLASSTGMTPNRWNLWRKKMIGITSFSDYVNWKGQIIIRLTSTSDADPVQMDFLKLRLLAIVEPPILSIGDSFIYDLPGAVTNYDQKVVAIDLFDTSKADINQLKSEGKSVICYFSAGTVENWRPDAGSFPTEAVGSDMDGWEGEKWLNTIHAGVRSIMANRVKLAEEKGCQAVDPDNIDGYLHATNFDLTIADTKDYLIFLANEAHSRGLLIGMKNAAEIAGDGSNFVKNNMDFAVVEECYNYDECDQYSTFIELGRPVFAIEYTSLDPFDNGVCASLLPIFESLQFSLLVANYELNQSTDCRS